MRSTIFLALSLLSALPLVAAHGIVTAITIDGKSYKGNQEGSNDFDSPIRTISTINPVKGATNRAMNCGPNAKPAALVADANPGSTIEFEWSNGNWPHTTGPIINYLASCGDTTCDKFDAINARWFKIDQTGKKPGSSKWFQTDIKNGQSYTLTLPNNLASGQYLIRHEIIGLHLAENEGGAEFYPSCSQINVGGDGTGVPSSNELVSFPGAYSDTDPGILVNAFNDGDYDFPGPKISTLANNGGDSSSGGSSGSGSNSGSGSGSASGSGSGPTKTSSVVEPSRTRAAAASTSPAKKCKLKPKGSATASESTVTAFTSTSTINLRSLPTDTGVDARPHRVSRVMRDLLHHH